MWAGCLHSTCQHMLFFQRSQRSMTSKWGRFDAHQGLNQKKFFNFGPAGIKERGHNAEYDASPCSPQGAGRNPFITSTIILLPRNYGKFNAG
jgi:hypothetical protein